jgi:murein DD-endopeptidase MepM/ murein hydrolase activator NlpD
MKQLLSILFLGLASHVVAQKMRQPAIAVSANVGKAKSPKPLADKAAKPIGAKPLTPLHAKHIPPRVDKIKIATIKVVKKSKKDKLDSLASALQAQLQWPFAQCSIAEPFGHIDMGSYTLYNPGLTLCSPAPVMAHACYDAVVENIVLVEGHYMVLASYNGIYFGYSHLEEVVVKKGDQLKTGDAIGTLALDETGKYSLLFLLQLKNRETNPHPWFDNAPLLADSFHP